MEIIKTAAFDKWLSGLRDLQGLARILTRIDRLARGNAGDAKAVGSGISELRIRHGPGYRVYYKQTGNRLILLLCGGDKSSQSRDIELAKKLLKEWKE